jgi:hypothetical protein
VWAMPEVRVTWGFITIKVSPTRGITVQPQGGPSPPRVRATVQFTFGPTAAEHPASAARHAFALSASLVLRPDRGPLLRLLCWPPIARVRLGRPAATVHEQPASQQLVWREHQQASNAMPVHARVCV